MCVCVCDDDDVFFGLCSNRSILSLFVLIFNIVNFLFLYLWFFSSKVFHVNLFIYFFLLSILFFFLRNNYFTLI